MTIWAVLAAAAAPGAPSLIVQFAPLLIILVIFYVIAIMPMRKKQQALQRTIDALKKGDRVITNGGIYGEVAAVDPGTVMLKVSDSTKIRVAKSAIAGLQTDDGADNK